MSVRIDRCICHDVLFAELQDVADVARAYTVEALQEARPFGLQCGLCVRYVEEMLTTGQVVFRQLLPDRSVESEDARRQP
jgi:bacterioferritin-associated ferredoxin